jgi:hypothetical protein
MADDLLNNGLFGGINPRLLGILANTNSSVQNNMAPAYMQQGPDLGLAQSEAFNKQMLAQSLRNSAFGATEGGRMVGPYYAAPSWSQHLAKLGGVFAGEAISKRGMEEYTKAKQANQQAQEAQRQAETAQLMRALRGEPGVQAPPDSLGGGPSMPAVAPDMNRANELLVNSQDPQLRALGMARLMPKPAEPYTLSADQKRFGGNNEVLASNTGPVDYNKPFLPDGSPNPGYQKYEIEKSKAGRTSVSTNVNTFEPFSNKLKGEAAVGLQKSFETLQNIPQTIKALDTAKEYLDKSGGFVGSGGNVKLGLAKFFNNNFGTKINPEGVANTEALQSALFYNVMDNLKKMDASPSQQQQQIMQDAFGRITTDPAALPLILDFYRNQVMSKATEHNRRVDEVIANPEMGKGTFAYDIHVKVPPSFNKRTGGFKFLGYE